MAFTDYEKQMAILQLKKSIADGKEASGVADLGEYDSDVAALEAAYAADPATVTATAIQALRDKITNLSFPRTDSLSSLWTEVAAEVVVEAG